MQIRIATRKSQLALWQAEHVAEILRGTSGVSDVQLVPMSTRGDEILDRSLQKIGGKGLFIKELEVAMQEDRADIAVHSMKDVPVDMPEGFCVAAVLARANSADALVGKTLQQLPEGAHVGTSSLRRAAQLKLLRPDLQIEPLRGNVNTRLAKLESGDFDSIVLAAAGLERLGLEQHISQALTPEQMLPAAAQGVIGIECLIGNVELRALLAELNDQVASRTTLAERTIARILQADCTSPVAAHATTVRPASGAAPIVPGDPASSSLLQKLFVASPDDNQQPDPDHTVTAEQHTLFNNWILQYEMFFTGGVGVTGTEAIPRNAEHESFNHTALTFPIGIGFRLFVNRWLAVNLAMRDFMMLDKFEKLGRKEVSAANAKGETRFVNNLVVNLGVSFFFPLDFKYTTFR